MGLHNEQINTTRRPNSLISESSLSSGTSSSSLSKSSTSSSSTSSNHHHNHLNQQQHQQQSHHNHHYHPNQGQGQGLELINECQTLALDNITDNCQKSQHLMTNTLSSGFSSQSGGGTISSRHRAYHKRSTTIVSQLSMGIDLDLCFYF